MKRVTMCGKFEDFDTIEEALQFIKENWDKYTHMADIRDFTKNNLMQEIRKKQNEQNNS